MINLPRKYSQRDSRWGSILLGFNTDPKFNLANYGCLITCLSMASCYYGFDNTPQEINDKLKKVQGFVTGGNYVWNAIEKVIDIEENFFRTPTALTDIQVQDIKKQLDAGYPVMLEIDSVPSTSGLDMHFVLAVGYNPADENDITIVDPWDGAVKSLKAYLGWFRPTMRKTIEGYSVLIGNVPDLSVLKDTVITWADGEGKKKAVGWYVYEWFLEKQRALKTASDMQLLEDNYEGYKIKVNEMVEQKDTAYNNAVLAFNKQIDTRDTTINKQVKEIGGLNTKIEKLEAEIVTLKAEREIPTMGEAFELLVKSVEKYIVEKVKKPNVQ